MAKTFRPYVPEQDFLPPPSYRDGLPDDHLAFFVSDLVDQLDLSAITAGYEAEERGYPPYHPVTISNTTTPKAQMSARLSTAAPRACSGLMYAAVPRMIPARVDAGRTSSTPRLVSAR